MIILHSKPSMDTGDIKAVSEVIRSGYIAQGQVVRRFEKTLASFIGISDGVATSSGTTALHLGLLALGVKQGDGVILPSYVCVTLLNTVNYIGAIPQLCDINPTDFNISISEVKKKINKKTKAIIVPHMFGMPADIRGLLKLGVPIIEDCAHSIGAVSKGKKMGSFGAISIFSFYATKMLTCGEGGMVCSDSQKLLGKTRDMRGYDKKDKIATRFNYKMSDIQAALGLNQLSKLSSFIAKRKRLAFRYNSCFSKYNIEIPIVSTNKENIFYRYIIGVNKNINKVIEDLRKKGIVCERPVYRPIHRYLKLKDFPNTDRAWRSVLSIPLYPSLTESEIRVIKGRFRDYFGYKNGQKNEK